MVLVALGEWAGEPGAAARPRGDPGWAGWAFCWRTGVMVAEVVVVVASVADGVEGRGATGELPGDADNGRAFSFWATLFSRTYV